MSDEIRGDEYPPHHPSADMVREPESSSGGASAYGQSSVGIGSHGRQLIASGRLSVPKTRLASLGRPVSQPCSMPISQALREQRAES